MALAAWASLLFGGAVLLAIPKNAVWAQSAPAPAVKIAVRRLTESQYRHTIADAFGKDIKINARFEPERREDGLLALGATQLSITSSGFSQYFSLANSISDQALAPERREKLVPCKPVNPAAADDACTRQFLTTQGAKLFRRPLTEAEIASRVKTAAAGAVQNKDFYAGLKLALTSVLIAPDFLFRVETAEPDPAAPGKYRLDGYTKASRLSYLFWDAPPDATLLAAAKSGELHSITGLNEQVSRLAASPRLEDGARAFFTDMLQFDAFDGLNKDAATYPKFSQAVADSAREQTLKTVIDLLLTKKGDYRDLFTSNDTFINRPLAAVYNVPFLSGGEWMAYHFPPESERSGVLTQVTFLSLFSHPGASSPTKRGVKLHEIFMCQPTPEPPPDVDFSKVQALANGTVRTRLLDHMTNSGCAVCHRASDPPGLTLEHFDGLGQLRTLENDKPIDVSADLYGEKFSGAQGLGQALHKRPEVPACLVRNVYAYGVGRKPGVRDEIYLEDQAAAFARSGYQVPKLFVQIATSPEFFTVVLPPGATAAAQPKQSGKPT